MTRRHRPIFPGAISFALSRLDLRVLQTADTAG
jgi:hypothetical protein